MARTAGQLFSKTSPFGNTLGRLLGKNSSASKFLSPVDTVADNLAAGKPLTTRSLLDPGGYILQKPPGPPPPPPVFPDVAGAALAARRNVRKKAVGQGVGSTILTGGYSPTGQAAGALGGA